MAIRAKTLAFQLPFRALAAGASGSGKTLWVVRMLLEQHPGIPILWVAPRYSLDQRALDALRMALGPLFTEVDATDGWTDKVRKTIMKRLQDKPRDAPIIIVIDDLLATAGARRGDFVGMLYTTARHLSGSILEIAQRIFPAERAARTQRLNCSHYILGSFAGGQREVGSLLQQLEGPERARAVLAEYCRLMDESPFNRLIITTGEPSGSPLRFRSELDQGLQF